MRSLRFLPALLVALALAAGTASAQTSYKRPNYYTPSNFGMLRPSGFTPSNFGMSRPSFGMPDPSYYNPAVVGTVNAATPIPTYQLPSVPAVFAPGQPTTYPMSNVAPSNFANTAPSGTPAVIGFQSQPSAAYTPRADIILPPLVAPLGTPTPPPNLPSAPPAGTPTSLTVQTIPTYTGPQYQSSFYEPLRRVYGGGQ